MGEWLLSGRDRLIFVPEGQASQARSAWIAMQRGPRPGGTVEVIVSPTVRFFKNIEEFCPRGFQLHDQEIQRVHKIKNSPYDLRVFS
jgi:hypothetical protein